MYVVWATTYREALAMVVLTEVPSCVGVESGEWRVDR